MLAQGAKLTSVGTGLNKINMPIPITVGKRFGKRSRTKIHWSKKVTESSDAMDLEKNVFLKKSPKSIARSIKKSVEKSNRLKSMPLKSGISMLSFYINRAGSNLSSERKRTIMKAKNELRKLYKRDKKRRSKRRSK